MFEGSLSVKGTGGVCRNKRPSDVPYIRGQLTALRRSQLTIGTTQSTALVRADVRQLTLSMSLLSLD